MDIQDLLPAPPPFLPAPRALINIMEGLRPYEAYALNGNTMEELGTVWAGSEGEAIEAAENVAAEEGVRFSAIEVERKLI